MKNAYQGEIRESHIPKPVALSEAVVIVAAAICCGWFVSNVATVFWRLVTSAT